MKNSDQPINPVTIHQFMDGDRVKSEILTGLTKREYFAALAMQGLLSTDAKYNGKVDMVALIKDAVLHADELLKQLEEK